MKGKGPITNAVGTTLKGKSKKGTNKKRLPNTANNMTNSFIIIISCKFFLKIYCSLTLQN